MSDVRIFENTVMYPSKKIDMKENLVKVPKQGDKCGIRYSHNDLFTTGEIPMWFVGSIVSVVEACSSEGWKIMVEFNDATDEEVYYPNDDVQLLEKSSNLNYWFPSAVANTKSPACFYNENPKSLSVGDVVETFYQNGKEEGKWWSGRISAIHKEKNRADIAYFDGEFELGVPMNEGKIHLISKGSFRTNEWLLNAVYPRTDQFQLEDEDEANDQIVKIFTKSGSDPLEFPPDEDKNDDILCNIKSVTGEISEGTYLSVLCEMFSRLQQQKKAAGKVKVWPGYSVYDTAAVFIKVEGSAGVSKRHKVRILESDHDDDGTTHFEEANSEYSVDSDLFSDSTDEISCDEALNSPCVRPAIDSSKEWGVTNLRTKNGWGTLAGGSLQDQSHYGPAEGVDRGKRCTGWGSVANNTVNNVSGWGISTTVVTPDKALASSARGCPPTKQGIATTNGWGVTNSSSGGRSGWSATVVTAPQRSPINSKHLTPEQLPRQKGRIHYRQPCGGNRALIIPKCSVQSEFPLFVHTETKDDFFLRYHFGDRLHVVEITTSQESQVFLEKEKTLYGQKCFLIVTKFVKAGDSNVSQRKLHVICSKATGAHIKAFYLTAHPYKGSFSRDDVQSELDAIANFSELSLNPGKLASRLELLVSPARKNKGSNDKKRPYIYRLPLSKFEEISLLDNQSDGCGFIPGELLEEYLGQGTIARDAHAVQVRVYSPHLGIFKGMLVRKRGIKKIQLPSSMKKVGKSPTAQHGKNPEAILLIKDISPSELNIDHERTMNPNIKSLPRQSSMNMLKGFDGTIMKILLECDVPEDLILDYNDRASQCFSGRMHAYMFGLCDCTGGSLPDGSIFISGFGTGAGMQTKKVIVTRPPFTEAKDLVVLPIVTEKPREMCQADWDHICSLSFGAILFGSPSDPKAKSLPGRVNNGDLDGDRYCVIWQPEIVRYVEQHNSGCEEEESSEESSGDESYPDELIGCQLQLDCDGKSVKATIERKLLNGKYSVKWDSGVKHMTFEEIMDTRNGVERIISHRGQGRNAKVQVLWDNGEKTWECLQHMRDQVDDIVAQYACDCGLLEESGWKWAADFVRPKCIVQIKSHRFVRNTVEFEVWYDGDDEAEWIDKDEVDVTLLDEYVRGKDIPLKGRWKWLQDKVQKAQQNWFERVQDKLADAQHMNDHDKLVKKLHSLYKAEVKANGTYGNDALSFGRAYKKSLDLGKHGGRVSLPLHLKLKVTPKNKATFADKFIKYEECSTG